jgi:hypothetical protein
VLLRLLALAFVVLFAANVALYLHHRSGRSDGPVTVTGYSFRLPGNGHLLELRQQDPGAAVRRAMRTARSLTPLPLPDAAAEHSGCAVHDLRIGLSDFSTQLYEKCTLPPALDRLARYLASLPRRRARPAGGAAQP